jgi:hypothetical protein
MLSVLSATVHTKLGDNLCCSRNRSFTRRLSLRMTTPNDPTIRSGAARVEETEYLAAGLTVPRDSSPAGSSLDESGSQTLETELTDLTLSMLTQGSSTRVRVGNPRNSSELYEYAYDSADEANTAMLDGGILTPDQVADLSRPAGTGIPLAGVTVEQLEAAGLKRRATTTL